MNPWHWLTERWQDWRSEQIERSLLEYKITSHRDWPSVYEFIGHHQALLQEYAEILATVTRLSFFVSNHEVRQTTRKSQNSKLFYYLFNKFLPLRFFVIRPLIRLLVETHVRSKLKEIGVAYIQTIPVIPTNHPEKEKYKAWLHDTREQCKELRNSLGTSRTLLDWLKSILGSVAPIFLAIWGAANISDFAATMLLNSSRPLSEILLEHEAAVTLSVFLILLLLILGLYFYLFLSAAFSIKRDLFLSTPIEGADNLYLTENKLFSILQRGKQTEIPIDYLGSATFTLLMFVLFYWTNYEFNRIITQTNNASAVLICNPFPIILVILAFTFFARDLYPILRRSRTALM